MTSVAVVQNGNVPTLQNENKDVQPLLNCSIVHQTGVTVPVVTEVSELITVTDISPTPCYVYETLNVTNIYNTTQVITVNETETVQVTASVDLLNVINVTETFNVTEIVTETVIVSSISVETFATPVTDILGNLLTVTSTINFTVTYNVTNVFNVTDTYNFTSTIYYSQCADSCRNGTYSYLSPNDPLLLDAIASMSKELTVDKKTTNSAIRKLTSASDSRPSSRAIGISGLILLIVPLSLIVICDLPAVLHNTKRMIDRSRRHCAYQP